MRETRFLKACRGEAVDTTPVWIMRQAGRYMPEYRAVRAKHGFLEMCGTPELVVEVTMQPVDLIGTDAAILFSDILVLFPGLGIPIEFIKGRGPVVDPPLRTEADIRALRAFDPEEHVPYVLESIKLLRQELVGKVPLIGFSGAPFTLACYAVEGGGSKSFNKVKGLMLRRPELFAELMTTLTDAVIVYLKAQLAAGAQAVQVFDTWAGLLAPDDYARHVYPHTERIIQAVTEAAAGQAPVIHYANGAPHLLDQFSRLGADVLGVDWRTPLGDVIDQLGPEAVVQGNLDPCALYAAADERDARAAAIVEAGRRARGHVFNLGHGVHPDTDPAAVKALVETVHRCGQR